MRTASRWPPSCGTHWGTAPTPPSSRRRPEEHGSAQDANWLTNQGIAHPPSTVWELQHHQDHLLPSLGGRDLPDGSATPSSSPLQRAPRDKRNYEKMKLKLKTTLTQSSRRLPGRTQKMSGRGVREEENDREVWKKDEERKKEEKKTYLLEPEPDASPGSSVPASSKPAEVTRLGAVL
jgi:hypothetical protein